MKILVLNSGSSSIKFQLFEMNNDKVLASGLLEQIGESTGSISLTNEKNEKNSYQQKINNHREGLMIVCDFLIQEKIISSFDELSGVGHRVVHGGPYSTPLKVDKKSLQELKNATLSLAPLHAPANLGGVEVAMELSPNVPQVLVFDSAYHQTIPQYAHQYAIPYDYYQRLHVKKYGFHGTSHFFVAKEAAKYIDKPFDEFNAISFHLGNGGSVTAIKNGKSIDTTMGLTPLEGLIMGTRSGDIDPAVLFYLAKNDNLKLEEMDNLLNKKSGLKGVCGSNDMREVEQRAKEGDKKAQLAHDMFCYRIRKYFGAYALAIGKIDAIIFTGGIGENSSLVREKVCKDLKEIIGIELDDTKNKNTTRGQISPIQTKNSKSAILVVPTNEELEIAKQTAELL